MGSHAEAQKFHIRELNSVRDLERVLLLEKEVWGFSDADVTPLPLAVATQNAGSLWLGAFDLDELVGFAFAFPSLHRDPANVGSSDPLAIAFHSHTLAVRESYRDAGIGYQLKLALRERLLRLGIRELSWTFDPLRSRNAHLNFCKLGVISHSYRVDFYGSQTSSPLHSNSTDRLWVTWQMADARVEGRLKGKDLRPDLLDELAHVPPLVRFNGNGVPVESDLSEALARQRIAIEIPGDMERIEDENRELARQWRLSTRRAFTQALNAGFVVEEFCRSIRGQQGPGAYLLRLDETRKRR